jgi:hypothetical protein
VPGGWAAGAGVVAGNTVVAEHNGNWYRVVAFAWRPARPCRMLLHTRSW